MCSETLAGWRYAQAASISARRARPLPALVMGDREGGPAPGVTRSPPTPRQGRGVGPGIGAILDDVKRRRKSTLVPRPRQALDGSQYGGTQSTDISRINRRHYWPRLGVDLGVFTAKKKERAADM